jgi:hypothetical protein
MTIEHIIDNTHRSLKLASIRAVVSSSFEWGGCWAGAHSDPQCSAGQQQRNSDAHEAHSSSVYGGTSDGMSATVAAAATTDAATAAASTPANAVQAAAAGNNKQHAAAEQNEGASAGSVAAAVVGGGSGSGSSELSVNDGGAGSGATSATAAGAGDATLSSAHVFAFGLQSYGGFGNEGYEGHATVTTAAREEVVRLAFPCGACSLFQAL